MNLKNVSISTILDIPINQRFISNLVDINAILGQQQMENILTTLRFIENKERKGERLNQLTTKNIQKILKRTYQYSENVKLIIFIYHPRNKYIHLVIIEKLK